MNAQGFLVLTFTCIVADSIDLPFLFSPFLSWISPPCIELLPLLGIFFPIRFFLVNS